MDALDLIRLSLFAVAGATCSVAGLALAANRALDFLLGTRTD